MDQLLLKLRDDRIRDATSDPAHFRDDEALRFFQQYLHGRISVEEAAKGVTSMIPDNNHRKLQTSAIASLGSFLCDLGEQIPHRDPAQTRLVQLILMLSRSHKLTTVPFAESEAATQDYLQCSTMSDFKMQLREMATPGLIDDPDDPDNVSHALNFASFLARLTQCGFMGDATFGIWTMRDSLEEKTDAPGTREFNITSAALRVNLAGPALYSEVVAAPSPTKCASHRPGKLYTGHEKGIERWRFWKQALDASVSEKGLGDESQRLAGCAVDMMGVLETAL